MITTVQGHIAQSRRQGEGGGTLGWLLSGITLATKMIEAKIRSAGLTDIYGAFGAQNVQGEQQQKLDVYANQALLHCLGLRDSVAALVSEEDEQPVTFDRALETGKYIIIFDPLDGSSNIDVNVNVGTIFSVHRRLQWGSLKESVLQPGSRQVAAGYVLYGPSTMLVYTSGDGVHCFTLDPTIGAFVLTQENMKMPDKGPYYSVNDSSVSTWPAGYAEYVDSLRNGGYSARYIGSLVADFHRTLLKGGVFLYPPNKAKAGGKLRLLYEASPLAFIAEQAGGIASSGLVWENEGRILDIAPTEIHQRTPFIVGSRQEMEAFAEAMKAAAPAHA
jgi:fructose-1,6-bisphosphatase I